MVPPVFDPLVLTMDDSGKLSKAPHTTAQSSVVYGWSGVGENLTEAQAVVSLPRYGSNPELNAPNLPRARVKQLMNTISQIKDVDVTNLSYTINCFLPRRERYAEELDLPLAVALLSSYLQQPVPPNRLLKKGLKRVILSEAKNLSSCLSILRADASLRSA